MPEPVPQGRRTVSPRATGTCEPGQAKHARSCAIVFAMLAMVPGHDRASAGQPPHPTDIAAFSQFARNPQVTTEAILEAATAFVPSSRSRRRPTPSPEPASPTLGRLAVDLLLAQLAVQDRGGSDLGLAPAQATAGSHALMMSTGTATLADLFESIAGTENSDAISRSGSGYVLHVPLAIWRGATLTLQPGDRLELDRGAGSFMVVLGRLVVEGAAVISTADANPRLETFRPFIVVTLSGSAQIDGARFEGLGYGPGDATAGLSFAQGGLLRSAEQSFVQDSLFIASGPVSVVGSRGVAIVSNRIVGPSAAGILIKGARDSVVVDNVVTDSRSHAIRVTSRAADLAVRHNVIAGAGGNGILIDADSHRIDVTGNVVSGVAETAVGIDRARCVSVTGNLLAGAGQKGVGITDSFGVVVDGNDIERSASSGLWIMGNSAGVSFEIGRNRFTDNRIGISAFGAGELHLRDNDLRRQTPRLLSGEIAQHTARLLAGPASVSIEIPSETRSDDEEEPASREVTCNDDDGT